MEFRIADSFTDSLGRLTGDEQKAAKTTAFDLQLDPSSPGLGFHKLDRAKDKNFWSVRVGRSASSGRHRTANSRSLRNRTIGTTACSATTGAGRSARARRSSNTLFCASEGA